MKCPKCGCESKLMESLFDETSGAVFVSRDSDDSYVRVWPAITGIKKYSGCVEFGTGLGDEPLAEGDSSDLFFAQAKHECERVYYDFPEQETAWLVKPGKKVGTYEWERVDEKLMLL